MYSVFIPNVWTSCVFEQFYMPYVRGKILIVEMLIVQRWYHCEILMQKWKIMEYFWSKIHVIQSCIRSQLNLTEPSFNSICHACQKLSAIPLRPTYLKSAKNFTRIAKNLAFHDIALSRNSDTIEKYTYKSIEFDLFSFVLLKEVWRGNFQRKFDEVTFKLHFGVNW